MKKREIPLNFNGDKLVVSDKDYNFNSPEEIIKRANINLDVWNVDKVYINKSKNPSIRIILKRKIPLNLEIAVDNFLEKIKNKSPVVPKIKRAKLKKSKHRRELEVCLLDPHYGMRCFTPESDAEWSPELCANMVMESLELIIERSASFSPFEKIIMPLGNDFFHTDSIYQTTTGGTPQPEAEAYYHTFVNGEQLAINIIERVKKVANVEIYMIPGNHDRSTSFMLGRLLNAYYSRDKNVVIHADANPYKFHRFGVNLIGYEHGHSVSQIRLAALMANEVPKDWAETKYREWHLGDQHRKGSSKPSVLEEQGVSVEFLPGLTAPNEWHRLKSFNWQKRGTFGFIWDYEQGQVGRIQSNIDARLNCLMGRK